jgi:hypothetical protein
MKKKAYIYLLDAIFAITILLIGTIFIYYNFSTPPKQIYFTEKLSEDIVGVLFYTEIKDLCVNPGEPFCSCRYDNLTQIVCWNNIDNYDSNLLSMFSELIETGSVSGNVTQNLINEIFVKNNVIDEKRFGFSVMYTDMDTPQPLELYNTEVYEEERS